MESSHDGYAGAFRSALGGWEELLDPLSDEQFNWKPAPDRWSVAQCMDHVTRIATRYLPELEHVLGARAPTGNAPLRYDLRGRLFISGTGPTFKTPRRTLKEMEPGDGPTDRADALAAYRANTAAFIDWLERARGLDLARIRMRSPYMPRIPFLTFPVGALIEGTAGHEMRHLAQARNVVGQMRG